jgi:hypothetical protein
MRRTRSARLSRFHDSIAPRKVVRAFCITAPLVTLAAFASCGGQVVIGSGGGEGGQGGLVEGEGGNFSGGGDFSGAGSPGAGGDNVIGGGPPPEFEGEPLGKSDKLDLLLVIDNSISMADKQALLAAALPGFLAQLVNPCLSIGVPAADCELDAELDPPVTDLHVGVITTSLGTQGGALCSPESTEFNPTQNDRAHLLPAVREELTGADDFAALKVEPETELEDYEAFVEEVVATLNAAGETGCGFEAPLEAWYRFLIDPEPSLEVMLDGQTSRPSGVDSRVLQHRSAFLRPDSNVAIVMLSDENDCSIIDAGIGWLTAHPGQLGVTFNMPRPTSTCAANPASECCRSCALVEESPPDGCLPLGEDPACEGGAPAPVLGNLEDPLNLRCFEQKRRFGFDLLYPTSRYVGALTSPVVRGRNGRSVRNPLFEPSDGVARRPENVVLGALVGVPWQNVASEESIDGGELRFLTASELTSEGRWQLFTRSSLNDAPNDPFMIESVEPRSGTNPLTGDAIVSASSENPSANAINGHESVPLPGSFDALQSACTFPLPEPRDCSANSGAEVCECFEEELVTNRAVCQPPEGGAPSTTQYGAGAYPSLRQLEVLREIGNSAVVTSACPRDVEMTTSTSGYAPALRAIGERIGDSVR